MWGCRAVDRAVAPYCCGRRVCARRFRSLPRGSPGSRARMTVGVSTEGMRCGELVRDEYVDL